MIGFRLPLRREIARVSATEDPNSELLTELDEPNSVKASCLLKEVFVGVLLNQY